MLNILIVKASKDKENDKNKKTQHFMYHVTVSPQEI